VWRAKEAESGAMTGKDAIHIIHENVRAVQETGVSSIPIEALQRLLDHLDSDQAEKDMALAKHRGELAKYSAEANAQLELFKSVILSGESARKSFFLLNGGAAVAVLALIGHLSTSAITATQVSKFAFALVSFACGLLFAAGASGGTYLVQKAFADSKKRRAEILNMVGIWVCIGSLVAFCVGCYFAYVAIEGIAASQPNK
jgi:hypothetical protein